MADARSLKRSLSQHDQETLAEYLQSVRDTEVKVEKAKRWLNIPLPQVEVDHLQLDVTPDDPRNYLRTMYELIYLAFKTDSTRVATYQLGRENGVGISDYLGRAVGFKLTHQLSHETKKPEGYKNFGTYCRFINDELGRFVSKLKATPEPGGDGNMLDNTAVLFGSASSAFHLSRNYPLMLFGGALRQLVEPHSSDRVLSVDEWIRFRVPRRAEELVVGIRAQLDALLRQKISRSSFLMIVLNG